MKKDLKKLFIFVGYVSNFWMLGVVYLTFLDAWLHGGKTVVNINSIGESGFEFVFLPVIFVVSFFGLYFLYKEVKPFLFSHEKTIKTNKNYLT